MSGINRVFTYRLVVAAMALVALSVVGTALFSQDSQNAPATKPNPFTETIHALPPGGPPPRLPDGHIDFTGRYYPNKGGRMLDTATPGHMDRSLMAFNDQTSAFAPQSASHEPPFQRFKPSSSIK